MKAPAAILFALLAASSPASAIELCGGGKRFHCVVDGDTVWLSGEKIRIANIDTPESGGGCEAERLLAVRSSARLAELLSAGPVTIARQGRDQYRRTLARLSVGGRDVGAILIGEGLARPWRGSRERWCR